MLQNGLIHTPNIFHASFVKKLKTGEIFDMQDPYGLTPAGN